MATRLISLWMLLASAATTLAAESIVPRFPLTCGPLALASPARLDQHVEALGEQAGVWGSLAQGFEGWVYPFKLFDGWAFSVRDGSPVDLRLFAARQVAAPHFAQLEYVGEGWRLTQTWFVPRSLPGALLLLDYQGQRDLELVLRFRPSLAPMHLEAGRPLEAAWDEARRELAVREPGRRLELRVTCPSATAHREVEGRHEIQLTFPRQTGPHGLLPIGISLAYPAQPNGRQVIDRLLTGAEDLFVEAKNHYTRRLAEAPRIETPDVAVNSALRWSVVSLDQLRIRHPDLGYGLVSGYSSSGQGNRPRYCWFFEEPTLTSIAYHWLGLTDQVQEALRFLQRFQREDGKTVHEVVQSLPYWTNYFREFPYAYLHSDGPVYYLFAYGDYYRATGDLEFIRAEWPRLRRTLDWCFTAMDAADGLMRIEPGDWGSAESSRGVWKDTQLQGMWARVLRDVERLARLMGEAALAEKCQQAAQQARASIDAKLWNDEAGVYLWGLDRQGQPLESLVPHHALSFWLSALSAEHVERSLERMASADFRTDWGVRSLALSDPQYDPADYQAGSVWPVWNAGVIVADYRHERGVEAFRIWRAMVRARTLNGLGPMPEVLDGRAFQRLAEGVPHQMFSELAVVNGFFDGLLGLRVDAPTRRIELAPILPPTWSFLKADRIPCGPGTLSLRIQKNHHDYRLTVDLEGPGGADVDLAPCLPAGAQIESATLDGQPVRYERSEQSASTCVRVTLPNLAGRRTLRVRHTGGIEWWPVDEPLTPGVESRNLRVIRARWENPSWRMRVEGLPGRAYPVDFFTDRPLASGAADRQAVKRKGRWRVTLLAPSNAPTKAAGFASWETTVSFR